MKILKQLNKLIILSLVFIFFAKNVYPNEAVDIWNLNKEKKNHETITTNEPITPDENESSLVLIENNNNQILQEEK